ASAARRIADRVRSDRGTARSSVLAAAWLTVTFYLRAGRKAMRMCSFEVDDHRCVVGGREAALLLAELAVDLDGADACLRRRGRKREVDAQALLLVEGARAVVPPAEGLELGMERAERVDEARLLQACETLALRVGVEDRAGEAGFVPRIDRGGHDVEIAEHDRRAIGRRHREVVGQRFEPRELACIVGMLDVLAVGAVEG